MRERDDSHAGFEAGRVGGHVKPSLGQRINPKSPKEALQPEVLPAPPVRSRKVRNPFVIALNGLMTLVVLAVLVAGAALYFGKQAFDAPGPLKEERTVLIPKGRGLQTISGLLAREGVIENPLIFTSAVHIYKNARSLKAGEFLFKPGMSAHQVMKTLVEGRSILHSFTIPEGYSSKQIVDKLNADSVLAGAPIVVLPGEGTLLPETYKFTRGMTRANLLKDMVTAQNKALKAIWEKRAGDLPLANPQELVILASIVEKETGRADERPLVASVFVNRLRKGMKLQSDPTILYGLYKGDAWTRSRTIFKSEMRKENPYSTYQIPALPPGPIANPGRAAMEAVANPPTTEHLFFVADGTGGHIFAKSLEDHQRNVKRWRQIEKARKKAKEQKQTSSGQ